MKMFTTKKENKSSRPEHYLYLVTVSDAAGGAEQQVLDSIVRYASPEISTILMAKYDTHRTDYLVHAEVLAHYAQAIEMEARPGLFLERKSWRMWMSPARTRRRAPATDAVRSATSRLTIAAKNLVIKTVADAADATVTWCFPLEKAKDARVFVLSRITS